jgi:hypothetical protein
MQKLTFSSSIPRNTGTLIGVHNKKPVMWIDLSAFRSFMGNDTWLSKSEIIKRYRASATANYLLLQLLCMFQFSAVGKDDNGELYWF